MKTKSWMMKLVGKYIAFAISLVAISFLFFCWQAPDEVLERFWGNPHTFQNGSEQENKKQLAAIRWLRELKTKPLFEERK